MAWTLQLGPTGGSVQARASAIVVKLTPYTTLNPEATNGRLTRRNHDHERVGGEVRREGQRGAGGAGEVDRDGGGVGLWLPHLVEHARVDDLWGVG